MIVFLTMLAMGMLLGFTGTGGSGFIIAMLIAIFGVPVHAALGTSITAMIFTTLSGAYSHFREGNAVLKLGVCVGLFGAAGAYAGTFIARVIPASQLVWMTAGMLLLSSFCIWLRTRMKFETACPEDFDLGSGKFWLLAMASGIGTGLLSGSFGIGSTPFIQLALLILFGLPLRHAIGTTMVVILPIAVAGSAGYFMAGYLDLVLLAQVVAGTMIGSYIGAKFTRHAPAPLLRYAMILTPAAGGTVMLLS